MCLKKIIFNNINIQNNYFSNNSISNNNNNQIKGKIIIINIAIKILLIII